MRGLRAKSWNVASVVLLAGCLLSADRAQAVTLTLRPSGSSAVGSTSEIAAPAGTHVTLEIVVDTQGLTLEGYSYGVSFSGGAVSSITVTHRSLAGLFPDLFGPPSIDEDADEIRNINQAKLSAGPGLASGVYALDDLSFLVDANGGVIHVTLGLFGEVLGVGEGSCPGTVASCSVATFGVTLVPEPATIGLLALAFAALLSMRGAGRIRRIG